MPQAMRADTCAIIQKNKESEAELLDTLLCIDMKRVLGGALDKRTHTCQSGKACERKRASRVEERPLCV